MMCKKHSGGTTTQKGASIHEICRLKLGASFRGRKATYNGKGETLVTTVKSKELGETPPRN